MYQLVEHRDDRIYIEEYWQESCLLLRYGKNPQREPHAHTYRGFSFRVSTKFSFTWSQNAST